MELFQCLASSCPKLLKFAMTISEIPSAAYISSMTSLLPGLSELTICSFMTNSSWQWPDSALAYAGAFSAIKDLHFLAINHSEDIGTLHNGYNSFGKVTQDCSREGMKSRLAFTQEIATRCTSLQQLSFCPLEQANSAIKIVRKGANEVNVMVEKNGIMPFWLTV